MSDHTPTTDQMLNLYVSQGGKPSEFDRFINAEKADAWDEGNEVGYEEGQRAIDFETGFSYRLPNPYRKQEEA